MADQKAWTKEHADNAFSANLQGGLKGALVALGICAPGAYLLQRQSPTFRALPIPLKAFAAVVVTVPCISIGAEKAGEKYERGILGVNKLESEREERELQRWERLGGMEKVQDWSRRNQWSLVGGSWLATMVVSGAVIGRNKYLTFPQKLVQARVAAQASTVLVLIASGVLAGMGSQGEKPAPPEDHSWLDTLKREEEEERRLKLQTKKQEQAPLRTGKPTGATIQ